LGKKVSVELARGLMECDKCPIKEICEDREPGKQCKYEKEILEEEFDANKIREKIIKMLEIMLTRAMLTEKHLGKREKGEINKMCEIIVKCLKDMGKERLKEKSLLEKLGEAMEIGRLYHALFDRKKLYAGIWVWRDEEGRVWVDEIARLAYEIWRDVKHDFPKKYMEEIFMDTFIRLLSLETIHELLHGFGIVSHKLIYPIQKELWDWVRIGEVKKDARKPYFKRIDKNLEKISLVL